MTEFSCEVHNDCFSCPFHDCIVTDNYRVNKTALKHYRRDGVAHKLFEDGVPMLRIAERFGVSVRTAQRIIRNTNATQLLAQTTE